MGVGIPGGNHLPCLHFDLLAHGNQCPVWQLITLTLTAIGIVHNQYAGSGNYHQLTLDVLYGFHVAEVDGTGVLDLHAVGRGGSGCRPANMESTHG